MNVNEYNQMVYKVMITVLAIPDAAPKIVADKCGIQVPVLFAILEFVDEEELLRGLRICRGGQRNAPIFVHYNGVQRTLKGMEFMQRYEKEGLPHVKGAERPTVFISYNQKSSSEFVDYLEEKLKVCATVKRDISSIEPWGSISSFMKSIRKQDFAVLVITNEYLRSLACMYEVSELMKDDDWKEKVMFAVLDSSIYTSGTEDFIGFWQEKRQKLKEQAAQVDPENMSPFTRQLQKVAAVELCFGNFFETVKDASNPKVWRIVESIISRIRTNINTDFATGLDNTPYAEERNEQIRRALE